MEELRDYITTIEAARRLGVTDSRIRQFVMEGRLPAKRLGGGKVLLIPLKAFNQLKKERSKPRQAAVA